MKSQAVDAEKIYKEIHAMFNRHTESRTCLHGFHGYMESDGAPYIPLTKPLEPETELNFER